MCSGQSGARETERALCNGCARHKSGRLHASRLGGRDHSLGRRCRLFALLCSILAPRDGHCQWQQQQQQRPPPPPHWAMSLCGTGLETSIRARGHGRESAAFAFRRAHSRRVRVFSFSVPSKSNCSLSSSRAFTFITREARRIYIRFRFRAKNLQGKKQAQSSERAKIVATAAGARHNHNSRPSRSAFISQHLIQFELLEISKSLQYKHPDALFIRNLSFIRHPRHPSIHQATKASFTTQLFC